MTTLILMGIGAALMYFFDPDSGRPRRVRLRDRCTRATTKKFPGSAHTSRQIVPPARSRKHHRRLGTTNRRSSESGANSASTDIYLF